MGKWDQYAVPASGGNKWDQYATEAGPEQPPVPSAVPEPAGLQGGPTFAGNFEDAANSGLMGVAKSAGGTMTAADDFARKHLPAFMTNTGMGFGKPENIPAVHEMMTPHGTAESVGKGVGDAAQFLIPGAGEEATIGRLSAIAPKLAPLSRIGVKAIGSGLVNKAEGGDFKTGAALGGAAEGASLGLKAIAPKLAETAAGIRGSFDRAFSRNPGQAILEDTRGWRPGTVAASAQDKIGALANRVRTLAQESGQRGVTVSSQPARDVIGNAQADLVMKDSPFAKDLTPLNDHLSVHSLTGQAKPVNQTPENFLNMRQGFSDRLDNFDPLTQKTPQKIGQQAYGALTNAFHDAVPGTRVPDRRISELIPVAKRAGAKDLQDNFIQRVAHRGMAHTGALAASAAGAVEGHREGGAAGAVAGGAAGLLGPEILADPTIQMGIARGMYSPAMARILRFGAGGALQQADRDK